MTESEAKTVARALGGETRNSGGGIHLIVIERSDGRVVAISDEVVCEYPDRIELMRGQPTNSIMLV
jgi:hypothetical protein